MKIIATATIVTLCGLLQIVFSNGGLTDLQNDIARKQQVVSNVTKLLLDKQDDMTSSDTVNEDEQQFRANVSSMIEDAKKSVRDATNAAIAVGKAAGPCGEAAVASFDAVSSTATAEFKLCEKNITSMGFNLLNNLNTVLVEGQKVGLYLASIIPSCYNTDLEILETCVVGLSQNTTAQVESYEVAARNILEDANTLEDFATVLLLLFERGECIIEAGTKSVTTSTEVKTTATQCIASL